MYTILSHEGEAVGGLILADSSITNSSNPIRNNVSNST